MSVTEVELQRARQARQDVADSRARLIATGELDNPIERHDRRASRSDVFNAREAEWLEARQRLARLLVEIAGDAKFVPVELAEALGLDGRTAASLVHSHRTGTPVVLEGIFGETHTGPVWTSESPS